MSSDSQLAHSLKLILFGRYFLHLTVLVPLAHTPINYCIIHVLTSRHQSHINARVRSPVLVFPVQRVRLGNLGFVVLVKKYITLVAVAVVLVVAVSSCCEALPLLGV